ncbi:hypothetical protein KEM09_06745 [Carboxylicivirga mesophila]|uniref:Tetrahaem cytochrome domain-containing protein n=1 Tax=Carboxylicivirga mesophila TaxID=1166478 RepID=A0ABS5K815_9BACT|nr:cytochrome c3 family protein [Carboxylicivirga mesophila]MBS2211090.1 hypothetical protein [Carboxylicivirga mesophila]
MVQKLKIIPIYLLVLLFGHQIWANGVADNSQCLKCHGQVFYEYHNEWTDQIDRKPLNPFHHIDSTKLHTSVHKMFACVDCHSMEYETFPHSGELRLEEKYQCMDCHGGDETFAKFNFEGIEAAFMESVHYKASDERFNCWMCHDAHGYELALREDRPITEVVELSNNMCLSCHDNKFKYGLLSDDEPQDIASIHSWLPNQSRHFTKVRCIDCHTKVQSDLLVSHNILPKEEAVHNCVECHSSNSVLMESLYAHRAKESRAESGFFNAVVLNEGYIIGANRNKTLNFVSIALFGMLVIGLLIHATLRFIVSKKK